ncbi:MAG: dihydrodipicolinate synthase family protein, partial [Candidatus Acidiferrales bacterium]
YNATGLSGYVINGSTGESVLLTWPEIYRLWETAAEEAATGKILIAGTAAESTVETIEHTKKAAAIGYAAALVRTPGYFKPQMNEVTLGEHFLRVADASPIPVVIYSIPQFTGVNVEAAMVARLAEHPNIVGMKDSSGNLLGITEIVEATPLKFQTLVGSASTLYPSLAIGACGAILGLACALPELCVLLYEAARAGDAERARKIQQQLLLPSKLISSRYGIPGLKYALDKLGYYGGPPRRPLLPIDEAARRQIDSALAAVAAHSIAS